MSSSRQVSLTSHMLCVVSYMLCFSVALLKMITFCSIGGKDSDQKFIDVRMRAVGRKIVILSGKGGQLEGSHCA